MQYTVDLSSWSKTMLPSQRRLLKSTNRYIGYVGGFGSGKTRGGAMKAFDLMCENIGCEGAIVCANMPLGKRTCIPTFIKLLNELGFKEKKHYFYHRSSPEHIRVPLFGATIWLLSAERPTSLKGPNLAWFWMDEPFIMSVDAKNEMFARLREPLARLLQAIFTGTPEQLNWGYDLFGACPTDGTPIPFDEDQETMIQLFQVSSRENFHLSPSYVKTLEKEYDEQMIKAYLNGEFVPLISGPAFYNYKREKHYIPLEWDRAAQAFLSFDFNVDPMSVLIGQHNKREIKIMDEVSLRGSKTKNAAFRAREKLAKWGHGGTLEIYGDATGNHRGTRTDSTDYDIIREVFPHANFKIPSKNTEPVTRSYNHVNALFENSLGESVLFVNRGLCPELDKDLLQVAYDSGTRKINKKDLMRTHKSDCLRYSCEGIRPMQTIGYDGRAIA